MNAATLTCSGNMRLCYLEADRTTQHRSQIETRNNRGQDRWDGFQSLRVRVM